MSSVCVLLVGRNGFYFKGLHDTLKSAQFKLKCVTAAVLDHHLERRPRRIPPLMVFVDVDTRDASLLRSISEVRSRAPAACLVAIVHRDEDVLSYYDAGVDGVLPDTISGSSLLKALDLLLSREVPFCIRRREPCALPDVVGADALSAPAGVLASTSMLIERAGLVSGDCLSDSRDRFDRAVRASPLSPREEEVLSLVAAGFSNKVIARRLDIEETTVKGHVRGVLRKIGSCNRTQAAVWAQSNLIASPARPREGGGSDGFIPFPHVQVVDGVASGLRRSGEASSSK